MAVAKEYNAPALDYFHGIPGLGDDEAKVVVALDAGDPVLSNYWRTTTHITPSIESLPLSDLTEWYQKHSEFRHR